jgi:hypothetical protein
MLVNGDASIFIIVWASVGLVTAAVAAVRRRQASRGR